jgi:hypothetical protein
LTQQTFVAGPHQEIAEDPFVFCFRIALTEGQQFIVVAIEVGSAAAAAKVAFDVFNGVIQVPGLWAQARWWRRSTRHKYRAARCNQ